MAIDKEQRESDFVALTEKVREINPEMARWMQDWPRDLVGNHYYGGPRLISAFVWSDSPFSVMEWRNVAVAIGQM